MDRIWAIKFLPMLPLNPVQLYFDNQEAAQRCFDDYKKLLGQKPQEVVELFQATDLMGQHLLRPDFFPYCNMWEVLDGEIAWKTIDDSIKQFKEQVGRVTQVGFVSTKDKE